MAEGLLRAFDPLVRQLTEELLANLPRAYAFFGHSFGGLLAFGCARHLKERRRHPPLALLTACCAAPSARDNERLAQLNSDDAIIQELRRLNGTPSALFEHPQLLRLTIDILAADFAACASFRYEKRDPLETDIYVFGGRDDEIKDEALAAWRLESSKTSTLELFDGGHFFIREHEDRLLARVHNKLDKLISALPQHNACG